MKPIKTVTDNTAADDNNTEDDVMMTMETTYISAIHGYQCHALDCDCQINIHAGIRQIWLCRQIAANFLIL